MNLDLILPLNPNNYLSFLNPVFSLNRTAIFLFPGLQAFNEQILNVLGYSKAYNSGNRLLYTEKKMKLAKLREWEHLVMDSRKDLQNKGKKSALNTYSK